MAKISCRIYTPESLIAYAESIALPLATKMLKQCRKEFGKATGEMEVAVVGSTITISIENGLGGFASVMGDIVRKDDRLTVLDEVEYEGFYDWPSKTYFPPAAVINFKVSR